MRFFTTLKMLTTVFLISVLCSGCETFQKRDITYDAKDGSTTDGTLNMGGFH